MRSELFENLTELNTSYDDKMITLNGIVKELSIEFRDEKYGFIQFAIMQSTMEDKQLGVQRDVTIIFLEDHIGLVELGDKIRVVGIQDVYNTQDGKKRVYVIVTKEVILLHDDDYTTLTPNEIAKIQNFAAQPLLHQNLANFIFNNLPINDDVKLIGALILFCADSPLLVKQDIHSYISLLIVGASRTYKTRYLQILKNLLPDLVYEYSPKSDVKFITYNSRYKKGGDHCKKAGLSDVAKKGVVLIDNLEELNPNRISDLEKSFSYILKKCSLIVAVHNDGSINKNLKFPRKTRLLEKFDLVLGSTNDRVNLLDKKPANQNLSLSLELLKKYMSYAKKKFSPLLSKEARELINQFKERVLKLNESKNILNSIKLKKLIRGIVALAQSYARIALKNKIDRTDVGIIIEIYEKALMNLGLI